MNTRFNKIFFCIFLKSCRPRAMFQKWKNSPTNWRVFFAFSHPNSWISSGWYKKRCSWDWKVIDRSYCHISCYLNGGIHSDVASFSLGVPLLVCMYSPYHCEPTLYGCQSQLCQPGRTAKILAPHKHQDHWNRSAAFVLLHYLYIETLWVAGHRVVW